MFVFLVDLQIFFLKLSSMASRYCDFKQLEFYSKLFTIEQKTKPFPEFINLSTPEKKPTGYETGQHPSWFKSMKKKTLIKALDYWDFFSNSR